MVECLSLLCVYVVLMRMQVFSGSSIRWLLGREERERPDGQPQHDPRLARPRDIGT